MRFYCKTCRCEVTLYHRTSAKTRDHECTEIPTEEIREIVAVRRPEPTIVTPVDDDWDWEQVNKRLKPVGLRLQLRLLFRPWKTVCAPKEVPGPLQNLFGETLFRYKELDGNAYLLQPKPGIMFPGS